MNVKQSRSDHVLESGQCTALRVSEGVVLSDTGGWEPRITGGKSFHHCF